MPEITVKIIWDKPKDKDWLNKYNILLALGHYCPNTRFEVEELKDKSSTAPLTSSLES